MSMVCKCELVSLRNELIVIRSKRASDFSPVLYHPREKNDFLLPSQSCMLTFRHETREESLSNVSYPFEVYV